MRFLRDSSNTAFWPKVSDDIEKEKLATCYSVGWLMVRNDEKVIIMADYSEFEDDKEGGRHIAIPNGWVKSVTHLKEKLKL